MVANVFTKNEILKELANRGYFIDSYTLDTFFQKWQIEAIFEDEQGSEFFDKNALDLVLSNLFSQKNEEPKEKTPQVQPQVQVVEQPKQEKPQEQVVQEVKIEKNIQIEDAEATEALKNISLSDGTPLIDKVQDKAMSKVETMELKPRTDDSIRLEEIEQIKIDETNNVQKGVLEGAMEGLNVQVPNVEPVQKPESSAQVIEPVDDRLFEAQPDSIAPYNPQNDFSSDSVDFDDISLISESLEAQERFKNYLVSELSKKNVDLAPRSNEFKLDISERTLSMIARTMAKKIAKHVSTICSQDAKAAAKLEDIKAKNEKLEQRTKELEEQNKKLRLLLAESNKNLNSYKPSMFGLYKKVNPK